MKIKGFIALSLFFLFLPMGNGTKAQTKVAAPLDLQIETKVLSNPCAKRVLEIKAKITNTSNQDVIINKNLIPYHYSLMYIDAPLNSGAGEYSAGGGGNSSGGSHTGDYFILKPKKSYDSKQILEEIELFKTDRDVKFYVSMIYEQPLETSFEGIKVWKGTMHSNSSEFKFKPCRDKKAP